ncbi:MAG: hypothetical protein HQK82_10715 [Desulfovibrionaceae bacterium]|nr:hypothetical protein [Desulfovibrionaceae bacterium]
MIGHYYLWYIFMKYFRVYINILYMLLKAVICEGEASFFLECRKKAHLIGQQIGKHMQHKFFPGVRNKTKCQAHWNALFCQNGHGKTDDNLVIFIFSEPPQA